MSEKPYGHVAKVERNKPWSANSEGHNATVEIVEVRRRGSRRTVERAAGLVSGMIRIIEIQPYTRDQWVRVFGIGRL